MFIKVKKSICILLAATMLLSIAGCGNSPKKEEPSEITENTNFNATGYPIVNEPVTLKVIAQKHGLSDPYDEMEIFQNLEKQTNVKIEWEMTSDGDWGTQKPLVLASNDLPDLFLNNGALGETDVINNPTLFVDMTQYIDKYCPNIKAMFEDSPSMKNMATAYDGKIYGLPHQMPCRPETFDMAFINKEWLDNLGLKMPTTTDELYNVLKEFKEKDANGNGDPNDEIPMSSMSYGSGLTGCGSLYGAFGSDVVDSVTGLWLSVNDGKVQYIPARENFKEGTKYLQKLYTEGLLDMEFITQDWSMYPSKLNPALGEASKVGVGFHWSVETAVGPERAPEYAPLMPLKGPNGDQYWCYNSEFVKAGKYAAELTTSSKTPEIAMRWLDAIYEPETSLQFFYGPIGTTIEKSEDGKYNVLNPTAEYNSETWAWKFSLNGDAPGYCGDTFSENVTPPSEVQAKLDADKEYQKYLKPEYMPLVNLTKEQADELSTLSLDLGSYMNETVSGWIVNGTDIDAEWSNYVSNLEKLSYTRYEEIYQKAYNDYVK